MTELISKGTFGPGIFACNDIYATYEELKSKGVEFIKPPTKEFYGTEALFKDDSGNWFSLQQGNNPSKRKGNMKTIFDKTTRDELINRINSLNENSNPQWGKMNVSQMVKHCTQWDEMAWQKEI